MFFSGPSGTYGSVILGIARSMRNADNGSLRWCWCECRHIPCPPCKRIATRLSAQPLISHRDRARASAPGYRGAWHPAGLRELFHGEGAFAPYPLQVAHLPQHRSPPFRERTSRLAGRSVASVIRRTRRASRRTAKTLPLLFCLHSKAIPMQINITITFPDSSGGGSTMRPRPRPSERDGSRRR